MIQEIQADPRYGFSDLLQSLSIPSATEIVAKIVTRPLAAAVLTFSEVHDGNFSIFGKNRFVFHNFWLDCPFSFQFPLLALHPKIVSGDWNHGTHPEAKLA